MLLSARSVMELDISDFRDNFPYFIEPFQAEKEVFGHGQGTLNWLTLFFSEICQGFTLAGQRCRRKIKTGRYCHEHGKGKGHT